MKESVMTGKAQIVLCAQDAAERTLRHAQEFCEGLTDFYVMSLTKEELDQITRKPTVVFAVTDCELAICAGKPFPSKRHKRRNAHDH